MNAIRCVCALLLCAMLGAIVECAAAQNEEGTIVPVVEWKGYSVHGEVQREWAVIHTPERWQEVWRRAMVVRDQFFGDYYYTQSPKIDFGKYMVLAVFTGTGPGNRDVQITKIVKTKKGLKIYVRETKVDAIEIWGEAPFHFAVVPKVDGEVAFVDG